MRSSFYEDMRHCPACAAYVRYLLALDVGYCVECGRRVTLFSTADLAALLKGPPAAKAGRPARWQGLEEEPEASEVAALPA